MQYVHEIPLEPRLSPNPDSFFKSISLISRIAHLNMLYLIS